MSAMCTGLIGIRYGSVCHRPCAVASPTATKQRQPHTTRVRRSFMSAFPSLARPTRRPRDGKADMKRSEEHTSELQSLAYLVCRLLLEKKKKHRKYHKQPT